jgi:hypothetical protein
MFTTKIILSIITLFAIANNGTAQETVERRRKLTPEVNEVYHVLKDDYSVMQGAYAAYQKKVLLAAGRYEKNKKAGTWTFFTKQGKVAERFNYDKQSLIYEAPDSASKLMYVVDDSLKNSPKFTRPVRIGGNYYGFLPYINLIKLPEDLSNLNNDTEKATMELLVSPYGRLAECKLHIAPIIKREPEDEIVLNFNIDLLTSDDKIFIPATLNNKPVSVRILVPCYFYRTDKVRL